MCSSDLTGHNTENRPTPRERRLFNRESNRPDRPSFTKPWAEEKADRLAAAQSPSRVREDANTTSSPKTPRPYDRKSSSDRAGKRPAFGAKPSFKSKPSFGNKPRFDSDRPSFKSDRPNFRPSEESNDSRPPRREFTPRPYIDRAAADSATDRPRKTFSKPGTFGRKREGFAAKPSFARDSESRPPRRDYGDSRPPRREFTSRPDRDSTDTRPPRRTFGDKPAKPSFSGPRKPGSFTPRPQRSFDSGEAPRKTFSRSSSGEGRTSRTDGPPFRKFDAPRTPRPFRARDDSGSKPSSAFGEKKPYSKSSKGFAGKSFAKKSGSFADKKPFSKSAKGSTGKPAGTFDKFKGNKKPFGKRPPARKFKPKKDE